MALPTAERAPVPPRSGPVKMARVMRLPLPAVAAEMERLVEALCPMLREGGVVAVPTDTLYGIAVGLLRATPHTALDPTLRLPTGPRPGPSRSAAAVRHQGAAAAARQHPPAPHDSRAAGSAPLPLTTAAPPAASPCPSRQPRHRQRPPAPHHSRAAGSAPLPLTTAAPPQGREVQMLMEQEWRNPPSRPCPPQEGKPVAICVVRGRRPPLRRPARLNPGRRHRARTWCAEGVTACARIAGSQRRAQGTYGKLTISEALLVRLLPPCAARCVAAHHTGHRLSCCPVGLGAAAAARRASDGAVTGPVTVVLERTAALNPELNPVRTPAVRRRRRGLSAHSTRRWWAFGCRTTPLCSGWSTRRGSECTAPSPAAAARRPGRRPLALTSANSSGGPNSTSVGACAAAHPCCHPPPSFQIMDFEHLWPRLRCVVDGGPIGGADSGGKGSTVVDLSEPDTYHILRAGEAVERTTAALDRHGLGRR